MRVGIIGMGGLGTRHAQYVADSGKAQPVAFADIELQKAEAAATTHGGKAYKDYHKMLECEKLDAVFLCTPEKVRVEPIQAVAERGLALFCEKAPAFTDEDAAVCTRAISQAGIINSVGFMHRWLEITERMRELLADKTVSCCMIRGIWGVLFWEGLPDWYFIKETSGGPVLNQGVHLIDAFRYLLQDDVVQVHAFGANPIVPKSDSLTIEETISADLQFAKGFLGSYVQTWTHRAWVWEIECIGEDFRLIWDATNNRLHGRVKDDKIDIQCSDDSYVSEVNGFLDAVVASEQSMIRTSYADATRTLATALAINESITSGQPVTVNYLDA